MLIYVNPPEKEPLFQWALLKKRMSKIRYKILSAFFLLIPLLCFSQNDNEMDLIMERVKVSIMENPSYFVDNPTDSSIDQLIGLMDDDGLFLDVDYTDVSKTDWSPGLHCNRLSVMACAYVNSNLKCFGDEVLYTKIVRGLEKWYEIHPISNNWWWNLINVQQQIGSTLILMRYGKNTINNELEDKLLVRMKEEGGSPAEYTAANRSDVALHRFYRGLLTYNENLIRQSVNYIYEPICYTTQEGFQIDNSFFQHGSQCYIGGYADVLIRGVLPTAIATKGTKYAMSDEKLSIISNYMRKNFCRHNSW